MADKYVKVSEVADKYFEGKGKKGDTSSYNFSEAGGGEPMGEEGKYPMGGRGVWKETYKQEPNRTKQARTNDGKFTYNSVEGKETKYPGRGKTVPPTLTGGKNGVYIEEKDALEKGGISAKDFYKDKDYIPFRAGDKVAFNGKVRVLTIDQFKIAQGYDEAAKVLESEATKKFMKEATVSRGAGRYSKAEKKAAAESKRGGVVGVQGKEAGEHAKSEKYLEGKKQDAEQAEKEKLEKREKNKSEKQARSDTGSYLEEQKEKAKQKVAEEKDRKDYIDNLVERGVDKDLAEDFVANLSYDELKKMIDESEEARELSGF